ncbi:MAG: response regulator [Bacteroidota bacterium]
MRDITVLGLFLIGIVVHSQEKAIENQTYFEERHRLYEINVNANIESESQYLDSLKTLAEYPNNMLAKYYYHFAKGYYYFLAHDLDSSEEHYHKASKLAKSNGLEKLDISAIIWLGNLAYFTKRNELAKQYYMHVQSEAIAMDYTDALAISYFGMSTLTMDQGKKMGLLVKIDSIYRSKDTISAILANTYDGIGEIYLTSIGDTTVAKHYFQKCFEISKKVNYAPGVQQATKQMGNIALSTKKYSMANRYFGQLFDHALKTKDTTEMASCLVLMAESDMGLSKIEHAAKKLSRAIFLYAKKQDSIALTNAHLMSARANLKLNKLFLAEKELNTAKSYNSSLEPLKLELQFATTEFLIADAKGDYRKALDLKKEEGELIKKWQEKRNLSSFLKIKKAYEDREKKREISLLKSKHALAEQQKINERNLFIAGGSLLTLGLVGLFMLYRNKQRTNRKLKELDTLKGKLFTNISHEFRTPLTLISGPIEKKLESLRISGAERAELEMVKRNKDRLLNLVNQLLDLSRIDAGNMQLQVEKTSVLPLIGTLIDPFNYMGQQKNITFQKVMPKDSVTMWLDVEALSKIMVNLLSNAFKYTPKNGVVSIMVSLSTPKHLLLEIRNTNTTLTANDLTKVFDRFYRGTAETAGTGIGLALVKELVHMHKGIITALKAGGDVVFKVDLPVGKNSFKHDEFKVFTTSKNTLPAVVPETIPQKDESNQGDLPILLIVEDNADVQQLLKSTFEKQYTILTAFDGDEGFQKAIGHIPNIIIADVMMPKKDGIQLTNELKNDELTSHIPIVLLTARAGEENIVKGIDAGADDYMVKPFSTKILKSKVNKLIALRKVLQERYSQEVILKPSDIAVNSIDEQFLLKVQQVLDASLIEPIFNTEAFSRAVGMSRMQLHRKLKALTGLSTSEFIRSQRLKLAANMLRNSDINVSQIGYAVGFNDHSYFSKCFKEAYGMTPSDFSKKEVNS